ncbi:MAG TPA: pyridoxamine 5'-phosphate oxidase family protein [Methanomassiliicoccales archaeon]|nr:pyridoxamine 5'-phosphate oxidase family protein [Methanomassiliicoccales archaeon]
MELIARLLREAEIMYLATNGADGHPQIRAVFNLRNEKQFPTLSFLNQDPDDITITISTNTSSRKVEEIKNDSRISVYYCKPGEFNGVQLSGMAELVEDTDLQHRIWVDGWERYYPLGPEDPDFALIMMKPSLARGWATPHKFEVSLE